MLLLDDLGGSRRALTEWQGGAIRHLFDHRHKHNLPTFLTTNLTHWAPLAERYGDHVVSRMIDRCGNMTILTGTDTFAALCIISEMNIEKGSEFKITADKSAHEKCDRCWNYLPTVGQNPEKPELCERCSKVINA